MHGLARRPRRVLVVDDDRVLLNALERDLAARGLVVYAAESAERAIELARECKPECALVDLLIGDESGIELLRELRSVVPDLLVLLLSGHGAVQSVVDSFHGGAVDFLQKPIGGKQLLEAIERAAERAQAGPASPSLARAELEHIRRVLHECGGNISEAARRLGIHRRSLQRKLQKQPPH
jgi:two-component system response regulator RegA